MTIPLTDLLSRLEKAEGPDRCLDADLWDKFEPCEPPDGCPDIKARIIARIKAGGDDDECPLYTASIDAAVALVERVLPDHGWLVRANRKGSPFGQGYFANVYFDRFDKNVPAKKPALALLTAAVRALIAKGAQ